MRLYHARKPQVYRPLAGWLLLVLMLAAGMLQACSVTPSAPQDITIHIKLPEKTKVWDDSVEMHRKIVTGLKFEVFVDDTLVAPYYFDRPLNVSIPYKRGILKQYGITPENLYMYFMSDSMTFDSLGISNVWIDEIANRIFAQVEHFSTIVVREKTHLTTSTESTPAKNLPDAFELYQNYPNPFT